MADEVDKITRKTVTDYGFVAIPTGHAFGVPTFLVGYWDGERDKQERPLITFPEGTVALGSKYVKMYEPTEAEIDQAIIDRGEAVIAQEQNK